MLEHHAPLIRDFSRPEAVLWFNGNVEIALKNRGVAYALWRMDRSDINWKNYTFLRNIATLQARKARKLYSKYLLNEKLDSRTLFKNLSKLIVKMKDKQFILVPKIQISSYKLFHMFI